MFTLYSREVDKGRGGSGRAEQAVVAGARRGIRLYWNIECGFITVSVFSCVTPKRVDHLPDRAANLGELLRTCAYPQIEPRAIHTLRRSDDFCYALH